MLSAHFGSLIRNQRVARGLTQAALAAAAGVSRTIVSRLEQSTPGPVQTDVLDRLFGVLGIDPVSNRPAADTLLAERQRARLEHQLQLDRQRIRHLRLALELAGDPRSAQRRINAARRVVGLWAQNRTCSPFYIKRWSELLALPARELAGKMACLGEWEDALFQNTPWSSAWT